MTPAEEERLAALLGAPDPAPARAALARAAGPELARLAYLVLQHRPAAEVAAAAGIAATLRRADMGGWQPSGSELRDELVGSTVAAALRGYEGTREVEPVAAGRPAVLPADPRARSVVVATVLAGLPVAVAAQAAGVREGRARRLISDAITAAGSETRLREAAAAQAGALSFWVTTQDVDGAAAPAEPPPRRSAAAVRAAFGGAALAIVLLAVATTPRPVPDAATPANPSGPSQPAGRSAAPSVVVAEAGALPTLESCGIGPPDARLAFAGWLSVEELGAAPPDAAPDQRFYALVPAGDVAWNPPGLSRRIMPPVRGRLACLSTVTGMPPTVVGLPSGWTPPVAPRHELPTLADCGIRPADAPLAHDGWLAAEHLGDEPASRPQYALVTAGPVTPSDAPRARGRYACTLDPDSGEVRTIPVPDRWSPPTIVDGCPASPLRRFAGNLELGGPDAFVLLPPVSTSWWADDPTVRIMARLSPGPAAGSSVTAAARRLGPGEALPVQVEYTPAPAGRAPSVTHYVWLEGFVFTEPGCWIMSVAIDGAEVGWAVLPVRPRPG